MSAFTVCDTEIKDKDVLIDTLKQMGYTDIEVHEEAKNLHGYTGDQRQVKGHIIIRRKHIGRVSNDIGFEKVDGKYRAHVSDYDRSCGLGKKIVETSKGGTGEFMQNYAENLIEKQVQKNRKYRIISKVKEGGKTKIKIKLRK